MSDISARVRRPQRLLVIDDDRGLSAIARELFAKQAIEVLTSQTGAAGLELVRQQRPDVVLLDDHLPDTSGIELFGRLRGLDARLPVIWVTSNSDSKSAIEATRAGAFDYLTKPFDVDRLVEQVHHALSSRHLMLAPVELNGAPTEHTDAESLIGRSTRMQQVYKAIGRLAADDVPVLLIGEPGTGKQLVARTLHSYGARREKPFVHIRCRDHSPAQLAARLFGEVLADGRTRFGCVDQAAGGVLLLEDLAAISLATQSQLLQLLQRKQFQRVGDDERHAADVGLIISAQQDPEALLPGQQLHSDFYFAFSPFSIRMPALRDRAEDIPLLVEHFVRRHANVHKSFGPNVMRVSAEALRLLQSYHWPGNVAELQSVLRRALLETRGTVLASDYLRSVLQPDSAALENEGQPALASGAAVTDWLRFIQSRIAEQTTNLYDEALQEMESHVLREILRHTRGNQAQAARILGITRTSLRRRVHARAIDIPKVGAG